MLRKVNSLMISSYFGLIALIGAMLPRTANAQQLAGVIDSIRKNLTNIPTLISYGCYIAGFMLIIAGVIKIRGHVDTPDRVALKDGLVRLFAGACLIAIPWVAQTVIQTIGGSTGQSGPGITNIQPLPG